jgi:hypothetical protein
LKIFKKSRKAFKRLQKLVIGLRGSIEVLNRILQALWKAQFKVSEECHSGGQCYILDAKV